MRSEVYNEDCMEAIGRYPTGYFDLAVVGLFQRYASPGMRVLDTHLGSGSSRIAAYKAGLDFVGVEIDPTYYKAAEDRFAYYTAQTSLWAP